MQLPPSQLQKSRSSESGLSLIELLVAVAIMGILLNMALMTFGGAREGAENQRDKRNAQEIASVAASANAAGAQFVVSGDLQATIQQLRQGTTPSNGAFRDRTFRITNIPDAEIQSAMRYLALNNDMVQFRMDGSKL